MQTTPVWIQFVAPHRLMLMNANTVVQDAQIKPSKSTIRNVSLSKNYFIGHTGHNWKLIWSFWLFCGLEKDRFGFELLELSNKATSWQQASWRLASWQQASWQLASWQRASWQLASWRRASWLRASWLRASWLQASWLQASSWWAS